MKNTVSLAFWGAMVAVSLTSCATGNHPEGANGDAFYPPELPGASGSASVGAMESLGMGWPRTIVKGTTTNLLYQPQVDSWDGHELVAREAIALQTGGRSKAVFGVVNIQGLTLVDKTKRTVSLENIQVLGGDFPSSHQRTQEYLRLLQETFPKELAGLSLDELESSFTASREELDQSAQHLNNIPPKILFSSSPAILVYIDGPPVYRPVTETGLQRVINTWARRCRTAWWYTAPVTLIRLGWAMPGTAGLARGA